MKTTSKFLLPLLLVLTLGTPLVLPAQRITYSEPEREDSRRTNFEIIGKINGNYLVFKNNNSNNSICVYNEDMKLLQRTPLDFMPDRYINVDFVAYPDYFYMIYEHQHKSIIHCTAVKMDGQGKKMSEPADLDTTQIGFAANNKIYTTVTSENRQRIMVCKINSKNPKNFLFTTFLFNDHLELLDRHRIYMPMDERNELFTDFMLDNEGGMVFGKFVKSGGNDFISKVSLVTKGPQSDSFSVKDIGSGERILDEIKIKVDNNNRRYIFTGFYYKQKKGNIEGLYTVVWDKATDARLKETVTIFNDELRAVAKSSDASVKMAFNDFFIKQIITKKDGGYLMVSESNYTTSRGNMFNRWDYMSGSMYSPGMYYSPYYSPFYNPWNRNYGNYATRYHAENIMVLSFDKDGNLGWSNVIPKSQFDDETENLISYDVMNTGGELHFLFNQYERRNMLLNDQSISPDGKITRYPTLKNLDKGYDFMPRYGRQVSSWQTIVPCMYRNYLCFAKLDF
ncbi:MAG TPA: hypothetical protein VE035_04800 [Puia sp.]|nr:hypothetical protein [Puia sp.]